MPIMKTLLLACSLLLSGALQAGKLTVAAASDLRFAMDEIVTAFQQSSPGDTVDAVYGSSGKFHTQLRQGAPYDLFFSADIGLPQELAAQGLAVSPVKPYAIGRIVLWSATRDASKLNLASLADPTITRIAIANPKHAPYGKRAEEALRAAGVWDQIEPKLVYGENIAQTAQFVQSGNAEVGIIALALALNPELAKQGGYWLIPDSLHEPLEQGFVITQQGASNPLARRFAAFMASQPAREIMIRHGFVLPGESR